MSFMPFIAGKRACLGKTLAEKGFQVIVPLVMKACKKICKVDKGDKPMYNVVICLLYTSPSPRDRQKSRMPSSA